MCIFIHPLQHFQHRTISSALSSAHKDTLKPVTCNTSTGHQAAPKWPASSFPSTTIIGTLSLLFHLSLTLFFYQDTSSSCSSSSSKVNCFRRTVHLVTCNLSEFNLFFLSFIPESKKNCELTGPRDVLCPEMNQMSVSPSPLFQASKAHQLTRKEWEAVLFAVSSPKRRQRRERERERERAKEREPTSGTSADRTCAQSHSVSLMNN